MLALNILKHITNLSDVTGYQVFLRTLNKFANKNFPDKRIYIGNNGGIGSALSYFNKKILPGLNPLFRIFQNDNLKGVQKNGLILIDKRTDISFLIKNAKEIKDKNLKMIYIHGLEDYLEVVDQTSPVTLAKMFSRFYDQIKKEVPEASAVLDLKKRLKKIGLLDNFNTLYYDEGIISKKTILFSDKKIDSKLKVEDISQRIKRNIPLKKINKIILENNKTPKIDKEYLAALLPSTHFSSLQKMSLQAKKLHKQIKKKASQKNIDMKDVYFYTQNIDKSFQVASWIYARVNRIPQEQFYDQKIKPLPSNSKMVVVLDDFSGSGESLADEIIEIESHADHEFKIVGAAFYSTKLAKEHFDHYKIDLFTAKNIEEIDYSNIKKGSKFNNFDVGYQETNSTFSMEYMSPDNNNEAFNSFFSPLFTLIESSIKY